MLKKLTTLFFVSCALALTSVPAGAQMSDDAVIAYVKEGMSSGKSQNDIAKELMTRGVTREQAERLKARMEKEAAGKNAAVKSAGAQERQRRSEEGILENGAGDMDVIASEVSMDEGSSVFGHDIFTNRNLTFAPSSNLPTPANYRLGPGDEVIIDIWGTNEETIRQTISPDGLINIPNIGIVNLNGMTVKEADSYLRRKLGTIYSLDGEEAQSDVKLTLGNIRTIQVNVMGEVAVPGTYYLSSLSNLYHALYRAGGVSELGSLRDIRLIRGGKEIAKVDVYDFILNGSTPEGITLQEGDIVTVPAYGSLVDISGNVKRPMVYELRKGETLADLIGYAGDFASDAYTKNVRVTRQNGREFEVFTVDAPQFDTFVLMDGDAVSVGAMLDRYANRLEVKGAVYRPGVYQLGDDVKTVKELIAKAEGLKGDAFTNRALIHREREDLTLEVIPVDVKAIMNGSAPDISLKKNDVLYIPSIHDLNDLGTITVGGEVARPGSFVFADNMTIEDAIMQAGGLLESASTAKIDVSRRIKDPKSTEQSENIGEMFSFTFKDGYVIDGGEEFVLQPYDHVYVRRSPSYAPQTSVTVDGEVTFPGTYTLTNRNERLSDLVEKAGGVNQWAYVKGARLTRQMNDDELERLRTTQEVLTSGRDSVDISQIDARRRYSVGIDLAAALAEPGSDADLVLREGDILQVPQYINTVKISGNVMYPNTVTYMDDMTVRDYVKQAGGFGFRAKKNRAYVIYMNGTVARARQHSRGVVEPGCEIVVPNKKVREGQLQEILSVSTTAASLATMVATIGNIIR